MHVKLHIFNELTDWHTDRRLAARNRDSWEKWRSDHM